MKKLFLSLTLAASALIANAGLQLPEYFGFYFNSGNQDEQLKDWVIYAPDGTPAGDASNFFPNYSPDNAVHIVYANYYTLFTNSQYTDSSIVSDTWVITPEFEVEADNELVSFYVETYANRATNTFSVYLSDGGTAKEDFTKIYNGTIKGNGGSMPDVALYHTAINGKKGKKVRLAFVNEGNTTGMLGFGEFTFGSWFANPYSVPQMESIILTSDEMNKSYQMQFRFQTVTPIEVGGLTYKFETTTGIKEEGKIDRTVSLTTSPVITQRISLTPGEDLSFTFTATPTFDGALPLVITGTFVKGEKSYPGVAVMEEATGTWCGWCPYGAATLNYYTDHYNGENGTGKAIGIAVHGSDPMQIPTNISDYYYEYMEDNGVEGFPNITLNRTGSYTPTATSEILQIGDNLQKVFKDGAYAIVGIEKVDYNPAQSSAVAVDYTVISSFNSKLAPIAVTAIVLEDEVKGNNSDYTQMSFLNNVTRTSIANSLGEEWVPYFEDVFGVSQILYVKAVYDHVARGAFPSYTGYRLEGANPGEACRGQIKFDMPSTVNNPEKTKIVLLATLGSTNEILSADEVAYSEYPQGSGVDQITGPTNLMISASQGEITVTGECIYFNVYGIDGALVATCNGNGTIAVSGGIYIVKAAGLDGNTVTRKVRV